MHTYVPIDIHKKKKKDNNLCTRHFLMFWKKEGIVWEKKIGENQKRLEMMGGSKIRQNDGGKAGKCYERPTFTLPSFYLFVVLILVTMLK